MAQGDHRMYRTYTLEELLRLWHASRNSMTALVIAEEVMLRLYLGEATIRPANRDKV